MGKIKFLLPVLSFILCFFLGILFCGVDILGRIDRIEDMGVYSAESFDIDTDEEDTILQEEISFQTGNIIDPTEDVINILLVGRDVKDSEADAGRTDSMILLSLNRPNKKISMTSLMRDCYVQIPGYSNNKLNAAYSIGGYALLDETIEQNFGIHIDYNIGVNFSSFERIIDMLGGIELELSEEEAQYVLMKAKQESGLSAGKNLLTGKQALWYARTRKVKTKDEADDFGRTSRQHAVLQKAFETAMKKSIPELSDIAYAAADSIETDMSMTDMIALGTEAYSMELKNIESHRIPESGGYTDEIINRMMVLVVDFEKAQTDLKNWLYGS